MKTTIFTRLISGLFISGLLLTACSKSDTMNGLNNNGQTLNGGDSTLYPSTGILNKNLGVVYAKHGAADITQQFADLTFRFNGNYPSGQAQVYSNQVSQTGSWSGREVTNDFTISYPTTVFTQLSFLNREWTIGESSSSVVRLIAADGDEVHFSSK